MSAPRATRRKKSGMRHSKGTLNESLVSTVIPRQNALLTAVDIRLSFEATSKNPSSPRRRGSSPFQVLEYTRDWIPAFAGMTNF
jgi:hypothetical protein